MLSAIAGIVVALAAAFLLVTGYLAWTTWRIARSAERAVPPIGRFAEVGGERIHYVESGEGQPILMIHGLGGTLHHLRRPLMEAFGDGYRLIALDRPGSGYSTRGSNAGASLRDQARFIATFIDALGLERPLLVGHSLGGAIALATALDYPDKVAGLALLSPLTHVETQLPPELGALVIHSPLRRWLVAHTIAIPMSLRNAAKTLDFVFGPQKPPADLAVAGGALAGLRPSHFYAVSTDAVGVGIDLERQQARYGEITMPVGILFGTGDRVLNYHRQGQAMEGKIAGLELDIIKDVGHMPQYVVTQNVVAFIRRTAKRAFDK